MTGNKRLATLAGSLMIATSFAACGGDDEESTSGGSSTTASAEEVKLTTGNSGDGFSWEVDPTPTAETKTISYTNDSDQEHALIFARINEGYTLEEAYDLEGKKGSATLVAESDRKTSPGPGETTTVDVTGKIEPGHYALLCPIPGHYQLGQLDEFDIE
jgi:hypothetical protein